MYHLCCKLFYVLHFSETAEPYLVADICLEQMDSHHIFILQETDGQGKQHRATRSNTLELHRSETTCLSLP